MNTLWRSLTLAPLLALFGCQSPAPSLHALVGTGEAVLEPVLVGQWCEESPEHTCQDDSRWTFEQEGERAFRLTISEGVTGGEAFVFNVRLARIDGQLFLDARLKEHFLGDKRIDSDVFVLPTHLIGRIELEPDALRIQLFHTDWMREQIAAGRLELSHTNLEDGTFLITAGTEELQQFVRRYGGEEEAFAFRTDLIRQPPAARF